MIIALEFLKQHSIIHRDIKPKNILIHKGNIKISDFGVAKIITKHNSDKETTTFSGTFIFNLRHNSVHVAPNFNARQVHIPNRCMVIGDNILLYDF